MRKVNVGDLVTFINVASNSPKECRYLVLEITHKGIPSKVKLLDVIDGFKVGTVFHHRNGYGSFKSTRPLLDLEKAIYGV